MNPAPAPTAPPELPFTGPWLLAPMDGVTDACFRDLVLARNDPRLLGGAFTSFVRVVDLALRPAKLRAELGERRFEAPVGLQLMGSDLEAMARTAGGAQRAGAPLLDLNFGCPAKGALRGCAGAALLRDPAAMERLVAACVRAAPSIPVTAKIRAGWEDADSIEALARAVEAGGARLLTVHCRTRREGYQEEVDWTRIARAVQAVGIPVCGNGGIRRHADLERMRGETGCRYAMVGRAALADPWIFSGRAASRAEAAEFLLEYGGVLRDRAGVSAEGAARRTKLLLSRWEAGGLVSERDRLDWLRLRDPQELVARLESAARSGPLVSGS